MQIINACEQYFNAYQNLSNWRNNHSWTNAGLVISYFTIAVPLIVLTTYATAGLAGRIKQVFQFSNSEVKTHSIFQGLYDSQYSLKTFSGLDSIKQKEVLNSQFKEFTKITDDLGGFNAFLKKLNRADPKILDRVPLQSVINDPASVRYALLNEEEVMAFPLKKLSLPLLDKHVQILRAQLKKLPEPISKRPITGDVSSLTLNAFKHCKLTTEQIDKLIETFGENIINLISEEQILYFIVKNKKMNNISLNLYHALFCCLDDLQEKRKQYHFLSYGEINCLNVYDTNKIRFSYLSNDKVNEIMKKIAIHPNPPKGLLSEDQSKNFYGNLKAAEVDRMVYDNLFTYDFETTNKERFHLLHKEEAANLMKKFKGTPKGLLSEDQSRHFFGNLKALEVDQTLYNSLFVYDSETTNKERFHLLHKEEAANLMRKFKGAPKGLLSEDQSRHFFGNLKAVEVDQTLYNSLFFYDSETNSKERFHLLHKEEAANLMKKFKGAPKGLLSEDQSRHFLAT